MKVRRLLTTLAGGTAVLFALTAYKCQSTTEFPAFVPEICTDDQDNDSDGKKDCEDSDCDLVCSVSLTINAVSPTLNVDSLTLSGTVSNATGGGDFHQSLRPGPELRPGNGNRFHLGGRDYRTEHQRRIQGHGPGGRQGKPFRYRRSHLPTDELTW